MQNIVPMKGIVDAIHDMPTWALGRDIVRCGQNIELPRGTTTTTTTYCHSYPIITQALLFFSSRPSVHFVPRLFLTESSFCRAIFYLNGNRQIFNNFNQELLNQQPHHQHDFLTSQPKYSTLWFHLINVSLHSSATWLFSLICTNHIFRRPSISTKLTVLLFALHPVHTEAVSPPTFLYSLPRERKKPLIRISSIQLLQRNTVRFAYYTNPQKIKKSAFTAVNTFFFYHNVVGGK